MEKQRTTQQNKALHKFFELLADKLNESGYDMRKTLKQDIDIPWSRESVKDFLWRPIQKVVLAKESTTELETKDIDKIYDILNRHLGEKLSIHVDFPSNEPELLDFGKD